MPRRKPKDPKHSLRDVIRSAVKSFDTIHIAAASELIRDYPDLLIKRPSKKPPAPSVRRRTTRRRA